MKSIVKNHNRIEFSIAIGKDRLSDLQEWFPTNGDTGELIGCKYDTESGIATFGTAMIRYVYDFLKHLNIKTDDLLLIADAYKERIKIDISDNKVGTGTLRDDQYRCVKNLVTKNNGIVQAYTSFGKNVIITYLITKYRGNGNILIMAPSISILDEIKSRARLFNVEFDESKVRAIHATGFMNSNYKDTEDWVKFMNKVELIIVDESECVTDSMESILRNYCKNYKYLYGTSATANRYNEMELSYQNIFNNFYKFNKETASLIYFFGYSLFYAKSNKHINIIKMYCDIPPEPVLPSWKLARAVPEAVDNVFSSDSLFDCIDYILKEYLNKVLYIPVKEKKQGMRVFDNYCNKKKVVFWSSGNYQVSKNCRFELNSYDELKKRMDNYEIDILIGTSVSYKGVDFKSITDTLLIIGANNSITNQIAGRSLRTDEEIRVWVICNEKDRTVDWKTEPDQLSTPVLGGLTGAKIKHLKSAHPCTIKEIKIEQQDQEGNRNYKNSYTVNPFQ